MRFLFLLFAPVFLAAQDNKETLLRELNNQVWLPFMKGVNSNDSSLINGVNAAGFYWVKQGGKDLILDAQAYAADSYKVMQDRKEKGTTTTVEVRFLARTVSPFFAAEKCITKYVLHERGKEASVSYSIMLVTSGKVEGRWRKQLQYSAGETATAGQFAQAERIDGW